MSNNALINGGPGVNTTNEATSNWNGYSGGCYANGETSLPVRIELANGATVTSLVGYTLAYNTLDNNKNPTAGLYTELKQDFAGVGGDVNFIRIDRRHAQLLRSLSRCHRHLASAGRAVTPWGGQQLRSLDHFQMGPNLVRGFAPSGIGPRDLTSPTQDALGGSMFWGASVEAQTPLYFLPKEIGIKLAVFADAGSLWNYQGPTYWGVTGETSLAGRRFRRRCVRRSAWVWSGILRSVRCASILPMR